MLEVGFFIWKLSSMPANPIDLVLLCKKYGIKRLAIKVAEYVYNYNALNGDKPLMDYIDVLRDNGIIVEGWGYHYPDKPGPQGEKIEERRQKLGLDTYHVNCEGEWKQPWGMPAAMKTLLDKPKVNGFEILACTYRYPSKHVPFPFDAMMNHQTTDGASPQVYWALSNNPVEQLDNCLEEYAKWNKPVYPIISTFGQTFEIKQKDGTVKKIYWESKIEEIVSARVACEQKKLGRMYAWSLDWTLARKRFDMIEAATGYSDDTPPVEPPPEKDYFTIVNCKYLNGRSEVKIDPGNILVVVKSGLQVKNLKTQNGQWQFVELGKIKCWMHGDYLD